jgi:hypothetical protein
VELGGSEFWPQNALDLILKQGYLTLKFDFKTRANKRFLKFFVEIET